MFNWGRIVEEQIRNAEQNGEFNDLASTGKPIDYHDEETALEGDLKMAHHILKNANAAPFWIELDKDIRARQEQCRALLADACASATPAVRGKLIAEYHAEAKSLNDRILHFNCICPAPHLLAKAPLDAEANVAALRRTKD